MLILNLHSDSIAYLKINKGQIFIPHYFTLKDSEWSIVGYSKADKLIISIPLTTLKEGRRLTGEEVSQL